MKKHQYQLMLFNDNNNSFEHVIDVLSGVIGHNIFQAEQCALIVHNVGKVIVHHGKKNDLDFLCKMLKAEGLDTQVEKIKEEQ